TGRASLLRLHGYAQATYRNAPVSKTATRTSCGALTPIVVRTTKTARKDNHEPHATVLRIIHQVRVDRASARICLDHHRNVEHFVMKFNPTPKQLGLIAIALRIAADQFSTDAHRADTANFPRIAEQFRQQRADALMLADYIEA